jgi:hypothetical protein
MRTVPTYVGAATGKYRGTEGMPEVQKPLLEYPTEDAPQGLNQGLSDSKPTVKKPGSLFREMMLTHLVIGTSLPETTPTSQ